MCCWSCFPCLRWDGVISDYMKRVNRNADTRNEEATEGDDEAGDLDDILEEM